MNALIKKRHTPEYGGEVHCNLQGSKHAFSRILPSFLLFKKGTLTNVPDILDAKLQLDFIRMFGYDVSYDNQKNTLTYHGYKPTSCNYSSSGGMFQHSRSLINLFPIISRNEFEVNIPGGCPIGKRDISWYLAIMEQFGIQFHRDKDLLQLYRKEVDKLPDHIYIRNRSFSSTNIAISCAVEHQIKVTIENPSIEPEIIDLLDMISTAGTNLQWDANYYLLQLDARKVDLDSEIKFQVMDDRNHAVNLIIGAILLDKKLYISSCKPLQLTPFYELLKIMDVKIKESGNGLAVEIDPANFSSIKNLKFATGPYPKICSDWQPLIATLGKKGITIDFYEGLFESRLKYLEEYSRFGIHYDKKSERSAIIHNSHQNHPNGKIEARALDLRCGAGLGLLSLLIGNKVTIYNTIQIRRGYQDYPLDLNTLVGDDLYFFED